MSYALLTFFMSLFLDGNFAESFCFKAKSVINMVKSESSKLDIIKKPLYHLLTTYNGDLESLKLFHMFAFMTEHC
jgi:hypothetical protein